MGSTAFVLRSEAPPGTDYHIFVDTPRAASNPRLLMVMDGDDQFAPAVAAVRKSDVAGVAENIVVVGIGYGGGYRSPRNRRARDYTPTSSTGEPGATGGARAFLNFIEDELLPALGKRVEFRRDDIGFAGHSLGSLLGLYALTQPEPVFRRFLISSPSIWWDERSILRLVSEASGRPSRDVAAFLSVGLADSASMVSDLTLLEEMWSARRPAGLRSVAKRFHGKDHFNVFPAAVASGLQWLYGEPAGGNA